MQNRLGLKLCAFYDVLHHAWDKPATERKIGFAILWVYIITLIAVELNNHGLYPDWLPKPPGSHFYSIQIAFTLILGLEVISLIFVIPSSIANSMGKQMEIITLILIRNAFKELSLLPEPVDIGFEDLEPIYNIAVSGLGAVCIFFCLGLYRKMTRRLGFLKDETLIQSYVLNKKVLALCLVVIFILIGLYDLYLWHMGIASDFFETIYTALIFADIAMVLIAQRFMPYYYAVFRNSGFVIGTLLMRLSLSAPPMLCAAIAVFAGLYIVALTWGVNLFVPKEKYYEK